MLRRSPAAPDPAASPAALSLGDLDYRVHGLLPTDSKMSQILLATDRRNRKVILKIACVQQRVRVAANRRAIHNSVAWLQGLRVHPGIAQMQPIQYKELRGPRAWFIPPTYVSTLPTWPDNPDFLITEYLAGGTLNAFVGKRPLPIALALGIVYELAQTLAYLHAHHCVHRDLKPENVLFRTPPLPTAKPGTIQPVLIDFGVAAHVGESKLISGSRLWMAPELQEAYEKALLPVDPAWDVYALGLICCYMLSGLRPWRRQYAYQDYIDYRTHVFAQLRQATTSTDAAGQQVVAVLQQLLDRTLARDPRQRPTAAEFAAAIARLLAGVGIAVARRDMGVYTKFRPFVPRLRGIQMPSGQLRWTLVGLAILIVICLSFLTWNPDGDQRLQTVASAPQQSTVAISELAALPGSSAGRGPHTTRAARLPVVAEQPSSLQQQSARIDSATDTLPPPTLAKLPAQTTQAIPTLAAVVMPPLATPPTLIPTAMPTETPLPTPTVTPSPTRPLPTVTATGTATLSYTPTRQPIPAFGPIRLGAPPADVVSAQDRVEFSWQLAGATLAPDHCYELVFWDPQKASDKRSPIGAGRTAKGVVTFSKLRESSDPLLRTLARRPNGFDWGVRFVACADPQTILQDVSETRHYTYQP